MCRWPIAAPCSVSSRGSPARPVRAEVFHKYPPAPSLARLGWIFASRIPGLLGFSKGGPQSQVLRRSLAHHVLHQLSHRLARFDIAPRFSGWALCRFIPPPQRPSACLAAPWTAGDGPQPIHNSLWILVCNHRERCSRDATNTAFWRKIRVGNPTTYTSESAKRHT